LFDGIIAGITGDSMFVAKMEALTKKMNHDQVAAWYEERYRRLGELAATHEAIALLGPHLDWMSEYLKDEIPADVIQSKLVLGASAGTAREQGWDRFRAPHGYIHRIITPGPVELMKFWLRGADWLNSDATAPLPDGPAFNVSQKETVPMSSNSEFLAEELRVYDDEAMYAVDLVAGVAQAIELISQVALVPQPASDRVAVFVSGNAMMEARCPEE
jgi:hypothetical protein